MKGRHRALASSVAAAMLTLGLLGVSSTVGAASPDRSASGGTASGGTVTFAEQPGSPPTYIFPLYDGANSGNNNITYLQPLMWLPLYWFGHSNSPAATVNYPLSMADPPVFSNGNKTVTMTLKKYDWSNGTPVTARDLVFWMNLAENEKNNDAAYVPGGWMDHVASYSAPSPSTFVLKLTESFNPTYLLYNGLATLTPIPQAVWDKTSATGAVGNYDETAAGAKKVYAYLNSASLSLSTWDTNPLWQVVDGPWHLEPNSGFQVTGQTILLPNAKYSGPDKPKISEFEELPFTSATAEFNALESGTVDYGYAPSTDVGAFGSLKAKGFSVEPWYEWGITFIVFNFSNPKYAPLENQLYIRAAMQTLIDQPAYIKAILAGYGTPTYSPVPTFPATNFLSPAAKHNPYPYNPGTAKKLLEENGWSVPSSGPATCSKAGTGHGECGAGIAAGTKLEIPLLYSSGMPPLDDEVAVMRSAFGADGIQLALSQAPYNTVLADGYACIGETTAKCPASSTALSLLSSPVYTYVPIYYPDGDSLFGCGGATNAGNYCNKQVQQLIEGLTTENDKASIQTFYKYQELVAKQLPVLWFPNAAYQISAISPKLGGVAAQDSTAHIYPSSWFLKS
jgi:peptide/nickel transport system substrate-binding protein